MTTSRLPVLTAPDTATEWRQALLSQSLPTTPRSADDDAAGRTPPEEIAYTATAAAPSTTTTTAAAATVVVVFRAGAAGAAKQTRSVSYSSPDGADGGETVTNAAVVVDVGNDVLFPSRELVTASAARGPFGSPLVGDEGAGSSNGVRLSDEADVVSRAGPETSFSRKPDSDTLDEPGVRSSRSSSGRTEASFSSNAADRLRETSRKERSFASNPADRLAEPSSSNSRPERSFASNAASGRLDEHSSSNSRTERSFSSNAASERLDEPSERSNSSSSGGDVFFLSKKERDEASEVSSSSAEEGKGERKEEGEEEEREEERGEDEEEESPRPAAAATDGGVSSAASGGSPAAPSVSSDENERRDGDVSNVSARPTPTLSQSAPAPSAATTTTAAAATATRSNVTLSAAGTAGGSRGGIDGEGTRSVTGVKISLDVVATVASESGASHAVGPGNEDVPTIVAWTGAVKRAPDATTTPTITPTITITTTTTVVSDHPRATDMAAGNVTPSLQPAEGTAGKATVFYPTNPPAPTTASPPVSDDPQRLFPSNSTTVTVSPGSGDNSSLPLASSNDSLPFDVVTLPASSPGFGEEKESSISTSSAAFLDSTSGFGDAVTDPSTGSDVFNVTTSDPGIPDSSGDVSSGEVIDTTTTTVVAGTTFISPTLPSVSPCSELPPSAAGNGSVFSGEAGKYLI